MTVSVGQLFHKVLDWAVNTYWRCEWYSCMVRC